MVWKTFLCILFGYVLGGINPSYIIARFRGFDIRRRGSGNAGASNAVITMGKAVGIFSAVFDILKAVAAYLCAPLIFKDLALASMVAGVACILGHIFPAYMKFKGGKGLACLGGVILAVDWRLFLIMLVTELVLVLLVDYICIVPITASVLFPILFGLLGDDGTGWLIHGENGWMAVAVFAVASVGILYRHIENIRRIATGKEMHFSFLWSHNKEEEIARITKGKDNNE